MDMLGPEGEESTSAAMEDSVPGSTSQLLDDHSEIAASLFALAPHPNNYMVKFLSDANGEQSPILGEYFGVALAFAALGALMRETKVTSDTTLSPKFQRLGLQVMLKSAMDRLQALAGDAQDLEQTVKDSKEATRRDHEMWEAERRTLAQKLCVAEAQVASVERSRQEDAKANERVAAVFSSYEQTWKNEKKRLKREVELLRDEIVGLRNQISQEVKECEDCKSKARELEKLEGQLCEKEFLIASAMEEAQADQHERNQLAAKLEKLSKEVEKNAELQEALADVMRKNEEMENRLRCAVSELNNGKRDMESISVAKMNQNAIIEELLDNLKSLQSDVNEKEEVISVLMKRSNKDRKEKEEHLQQLAQAKAKRKAAEAEKDRWKRLAEERARNMVPAGRDPRSRRSLGSKVELDKLSEIQRSHNEEVHGLRSMYMAKLESLQRELKNYEEKVTLLEAKILVHSAQNAQSQKRKPKHEERSTSGKKARESVNCYDLVSILESVVPEVDVMQLDGSGSEIQEVPMTPAALKDWLKQWLEVVMAHHAQHLEKRHGKEVDAFERQMRLKDERLENFRQQLLNMESEFSAMKSDLEELKDKLAMALEEKSRAERAVEMKDKELRVLLKTMLTQNGEGSPLADAMDLDQLSHQDAQQRVLITLQKELNDTKQKLKEVEAECRKKLLKFAEDTEEELKLKDQMLAVVEAKLCQLRIQMDNEKRSTPTRTPEASLLAVPDKIYTISVVGAEEIDIKNAISTACNDVEKLASKIAEVRKQMAESDENYDNGLEELMDQATAVSNSGKKLSMLRNAISIEELNNTKITLFKDFQTTTVAVNASMKQEILEQPRVHSEEPSTSGTNSGAPEVSEEGMMSVDVGEPEVNSKRQQDVDVGIPMEIADSELDEIEEEGDLMMTRSERKRERRKTLKEYFLDSPPETENASAVELPVPAKDPPVLSFSSPGVIRTLERSKTLSATTSSSEFKENVAPKSPMSIPKSPMSIPKSPMSIPKSPMSIPKSPMSIPNSPRSNPKSPTLFATPIFDRIKSRRKEFNKTREDIHVLGLALEVRKIEEQLFQIDRRSASQPQDVTPKVGSAIPKISPGRLNKRYTALTGKVGHFAKQMGLTSAEKHSEMVTDNPLFSKKTTSSEIMSLQQRAEAVAQSLATIETQEAEDASSSCQQQTGYSKERLIDTVKTHLSQVQRSLSARLTPPLTPSLTPRQSFVHSASPLGKERM